MKNKVNLMEGRIVSLRKLLELSQKEFAHKISITQAALSQIESGKTTLSMSTAYNLIKAFELQTDWLLFGTGEIFAHQKVKIAQGTPPKSEKVYDQLIPFVNKEAEAGYLDNSRDIEFIKSLGAYRIPGYEEGNFRLFNINGDSMLPSLQEDEIVITQAVEQKENLQSNRLCVVITHEGVVAKRVFQAEDDDLLLKSDNPKYRSYKLPYTEVIEIWEIKGKISSEFLNEVPFTQGQDEVSMAYRLSELEKSVALLKVAIQPDGNGHKQKP